jgi:hypothetical protein
MRAPEMGVSLDEPPPSTLPRNTGGGKILRVSVALVILPHPGPLPKGEGEEGGHGGPLLQPEHPARERCAMHATTTF